MIFLWVFAVTLFFGNSSDGSVSFTPDWEKISRKTLPDVVFADANGQAVPLSSYKGKILILHPMFTHCPSTCTFISSRLATAIKGLSTAERNDLRVLSFSFDPKETTNTLVKFEKLFHVDGSRWKVVRADPAVIQEILTALDFRTLQLSTSNYEHPNLVFVVGKDGALRDYIYGSKLTSERIAGILRSIDDDNSSLLKFKPYIFMIAVIGMLISTFVVAAHFINTHRR